MRPTSAQGSPAQPEEQSEGPQGLLEIVIVRIMAHRLTPPMHTMYVDKPMKGASHAGHRPREPHFRDKPAGLSWTTRHVETQERPVTTPSDQRNRELGQTCVTRPSRNVREA
jgi:hypothetical protein